jgi:hypothetical protein
LTYLCDPSSIRPLDAEKIMEDLSEPETQYAIRGWFARVSLTDFDHVALATDQETGRYVALLVANDGAISSGAYIDLRAGFVIGAMRGSKLIHRLLAYVILRMSCFSVMPRIVAAQTSIPACHGLLSLFSLMIAGARIFPGPDKVVTDLELAGLARQIARYALPHLEYEPGTGTVKRAKLTNATCFARINDADPQTDAMFERCLGSTDQMMVVVDLRGCDEKTIVAQTTALVRSRWKMPFATMRDIKSASVALITHPKPTLSA